MCAGGQRKLTAKQSRELAPLNDIGRFFELAEQGIIDALKASYHDNAGASSATGVRHWIRFTTIGLRQAAIRLLDPAAPIAKKLEEEDLVMRFGWWLVTQVGVQTETAEKYVSTVLAWHRRWHGVGIGGDMQMHRLHAMWKGMEKLHFRGQTVHREQKRWGVRPQWLARAISTAKAQCINAGPYSTVLHLNYSAAMECAFAGMLRGIEVCPTHFDPKTEPTRNDVTFGDGFAILYCRNSKAKGKDRLRKLPVYLPEGGSIIDPVRALRRLFELDPVPKHKWGQTPLFRDPQLASTSLNVAQLRTVLRAWLAEIGLPSARYGAHSLRIGGATAFFESDGQKLEIQTQGRWDSDAYLAYIRVARQRVLARAKRACSTEVHDHAQEFVEIDIEPEFE